MKDKIVVPRGMIEAASKQPLFTEHEVYCSSCYGTGSESELFDGEVRRCTSCNGNKSVKEYRDKWGSHDFKPERKASDFEVYDILENSIEWILGEVEKLELCPDDYANFRNIFLGRKTAVGYCPQCGADITKSDIPYAHMSVAGNLMPGHSGSKVYDDIEDLLDLAPKPPFPEGHYQIQNNDDMQSRIKESYRRGKESKK